MMRPHTCASPIVCLALLAFVDPLAAGDAPDPRRVEEIAAWLPAQPAGVGPPIEDRAAWEALASRKPFQDLVKRAEAEKDRPLPAMTDEVFLDYSKTGNRTRGQAVIFERHGRFALLALAECLENRGRFLPPLEAAIREVCSEKTWLLPAHDGGLENYRGKTVQIDLVSAATSWNLATAAWWLGKKLSAETRELIGVELERRTFRPFESHLATGNPRLSWPTTTNNWNAVCLAGVTGSALASIESPARRAFFAAAAEKLIAHFLSGFTPDGYCSEGLGYWNYGFGHFALLSETLRRATGGKIDLLARPGVLPIARFAERMEILPGIHPAFADCDTEARPDPALIALISARLGRALAGADPEALKGATTSLFSLGVHAFAGPVTALPAPAGGAEETLREWFSDAGILICRPARGARRGMGAALKGGHNAEHHNHDDVGSFVVALDGGAPLLDPGAEVYTARTFSSKRYESEVLNSFGHPVPRVAGKLQRTGAAARARVVKVEFADALDVLVLDIRSAYEVEGLRKLERTFRFSRDGAGLLTVVDEVEMEQPGDFETALIAFDAWKKIGPDRLIVGEGARSVEVSIRTSGPAFTIDAQEIREDLPRKRIPVRLGIRLAEPVSKGSIALEIHPAGR